MRLNLQSIQGKFISLFSIVAVSIGILLFINYQIIRSQHEQHQLILNVWVPTHGHLEHLLVNTEAGKLEEQHILPSLNALNTLSNKWQHERMQVKYESLIEQLEVLQQTSSNSSPDGNIQKLGEFTVAQKTLQSLVREAAQQLENYNQANGEFTSYIKTLYFWEYILYLIIGLIVSTLITLSVMRKIRGIKDKVIEITSGNLPEPIPLKNDELYTMSKSLNQLIINLKEITIFADEVGRGNMDASLNAFDASTELGHSLSGMRDGLKRVAYDEKNRRWINEGIAKFALLSRQHNGNVNELSNAVIGELVNYVGALQGAIFITHKEGSNTVLRMSGCYAYDRQKYLKKQIPVDSGLIGQAYLEKMPKYLREIPKNYDTITTGLGQGSPESILMMPLLHEEGVEGVLELASLRQIQDFEMEFLTKISESLGSAVAAVRISEETRLLLEESQGVTETLRSQEEEMRQNMEEMQATQEEMLRTQRELAIKETNLHAFINNTTDSIITITREYKVGLINEVLKARYRGTQYEGIEVGTDIMPTLGAVAAEWKGYYDRAFAGEHLDFTLKSSVRGEDAWREYNIHPILAKGGEIVAVSVISRDTTSKMQQELKMKQKSAVLLKIIEQAADAYIALDELGRVIVASQHLNEHMPSLQNQLREDELFLNAVSAENKAFWKEQLDKALAGEKLNFQEPMLSTQETIIRTEVILDGEQPVGVLLMINHSH